MYTTTQILRKVIHASVARGASLDDLCAAVGKSPSDLNDLNNRVDGADPVIRLWTAAEEAIGDPLLGLHVGEEVTAVVAGLTGYLMNSSPTVAEAFRSFEQFQRQVTGWVDHTFEMRKDEGVFSTSVNPLLVHASPRTARHVAHMGVTTYSRIPAIFTNLPITPKRVEIAFATREDLQECMRVLRCPVMLSEDVNRIYFDRIHLDTPILSYDLSLHKMFHDLLTQHELVASRRQSFTDRIKSTLIRDFKGHIPGVAVIAAQMHMSPRTFQRKLEEENASYRTIGQEVRKEFAIALLRNSNYTIDHVADLLGYADSSSFIMAFKQWTGVTPGSIRRADHPSP